MYYGFALYTTQIPKLFSTQQTRKLNVPGVRDRAIILVDKVRTIQILNLQIALFWLTLR